MAYNATCSAVTGYSPYYLLFSSRPRIPVDYLFPTLHDSSHQTKMEVSVVAMQKRLKEAFTVARCLTSEEAAKQCRYYDRKAEAVALQPGDIVMVHTDGFVGKRKVKDRWEDGGFIVESQLEDWPVYKVKCLTSEPGRSLNTGFSTGTTSCLSPTRMRLTSQVKHRPRDPNCLECHPRGFFSRSKFVRKASTVLGDSTRRWTYLSGVVEWRVLHKALDTNSARGSTESSRLD